ncbi:polysaccharide biosynthesis tyrosine autokinase [Komarekiella sp. 'clone 1']|uniref:Polysaccharide biosynthesis tyrosine autokinase n=1 Tax=Komarekiella delphini-convector SJRDD-AB1 TaxID=2593771 RepID=A0AA40VS77_9NOST|nr:polysaccharide biosynthesis tyrosine autokinase [Komarekiella delphini-convector]MBD6617910.1 polysaccharide biosynthesis tyrosine autokinase [Komarekiella delphini-convector SJRDD-AB1]
MENNSYQFSGYDRSSNSVPTSLQPQPFLGSEDSGNNWSFREFLGLVRRRGLLIAGVATVVMVTFVVSLKFNQKQPEYESSFQLLVEPVNDDSKVVDVVKDTNSTTTSGLDYDSQIQVLKSPELMDSLIQQLQVSYPDISYDNLINALQINRLGETKIIEVRYRSNDPKKIKVVLDKISSEYIEYSQERRQTKLRQGINYIEKQLPFVQSRVDQIQRELQTFRLNYKFNDPEAEAKQIDEQIATLSEQREKVDMQLGQTRSNVDILKGKDGAAAVLNNALLYQQLLTQIRQLDSLIAQESTRLQQDNPTIQTLKEKRASLLPLLQNEAQRFLDVKLSETGAQVQTLEVQIQEIDKTIQRLEQKRKRLPALARQYKALQQRLQITTESLNRFLSTRENLQIQVSQTELGWQLLKKPIQPEKPVTSSDIKRNLIVGLVTSLVLAIGIALLIEKLDNTYHSANDFKDKLKLPLLGNIPFEKQLQISKSSTSKGNIPLVRISDLPHDSNLGLAIIPEQDYSNHSVKFLEAFRLLYTNIQLLSCDRQIRSIIISSAVSGDGKSTVAFHLAQIATTMGQRVLLIDANLRQPVIHTLAELNNLWGLSNLISTNLPPEEVIRKFPSMSQLSVITSGPIPPDPTKLLSSEKMKRLMADFHNSFDLVIYDTPPLLGLADASLLAPNTDGILLVVRIDKTDSSKIQQALDHLKISPMNVLGIVGNGQNNFND